MELVPEWSPILRHAQFEDAVNRNFANPVSGLFRAILPEPQLSCRIDITIRPPFDTGAMKRRNRISYCIGSSFESTIDLPVGLHKETRDLAAGCLFDCLDSWLDAHPNTIMRLWHHRPVGCISEKMICWPHPKSWVGICPAAAATVCRFTGNGMSETVSVCHLHRFRDIKPFRNVVENGVPQETVCALRTRPPELFRLQTLRRGVAITLATTSSGM